MSTFMASKTLTQIAGEYRFTTRTLTNHIKKHETLSGQIKRGLQLPRFQKMIYETFGYPPDVNKKDYEDV
jgi:hypothetical protein